MHKYLYLLRNIGLLTISKFGSKFLSFLLVPLYTSVLSTVEYGTYDVYYTTVLLLIPLLTAQIIDGVMRFSLDDEKGRSDIFSVGLKRVLLSSLIVTLFIIVNKRINFVPIFNEYPICFILLFSSEALYSLLSQFCRGLEKVIEIAIAGIMNSAFMLSLNLLFLIQLKSGLKGYFYANLLSSLIPSVYLAYRTKIWKYIKLNTDKEIKTQMYCYSKPLVLNNLAWWINNASDRYIVTFLCGASANGIYSIAYKIPSFLNVFQEIFSQAWVLSAVKEYETKDSVFYSKVYNLYNFGMVIVCSLLIAIDKIIAHILFAHDFFGAWKYAPFLMISVVFGSLSGMMGGIFSAAKNSKIFAKTTVMGASINTVLNYYLISCYGPIGAAIATLISYVLVWMARLKETKRLVKLNANLRRDVFSYILLLAQAITLVGMPHAKVLLTYVVQANFFIMIIILYLDEFKDLFHHVKGHL